MQKENSLETSLNMPVTPEFIERRIRLIRGQKVMLDRDLAEVYQIETKNLNKAIKRNIQRFPVDFMFQLKGKEIESLRFQIGTSNIGRGGSRYLPYVFTELGVAMLSSVLNSDRAIQMNIYIMRAFVNLRHMVIDNKNLAMKVTELEKGQKEHTETLIIISTALNKLRDAQKPLKSAIGFVVDSE